MTAHDRDALFIDGEWAAPATSAVLEVVSPHSEQVVAPRARGRRSPTSTPPSRRPGAPSTRARGRG